MPRKYPPMMLTQEFRFGAHINKTVETVILGNPSYIRRMIDEGIIELDNEAFEYFQEHEMDMPEF